MASENRLITLLCYFSFAFFVAGLDFAVAGEAGTDAESDAVPSAPASFPSLALSAFRFVFTLDLGLEIGEEMVGVAAFVADSAGEVMVGPLAEAVSAGAAAVGC